MLRREREEGLGYGSCVETGECTVPVLRSVARAGVGVLLEELFRFSDPIEVGRVVIRSRGRQHPGDSPPRQVPPRTAPPPKSEITDMRPVLRARAARACRLRGLVAAERNELRSIGASGSLGLCHLQSVDDVCHQPSVNQTVYR
jgi:hypothetical protein